MLENIKEYIFDKFGVPKIEANHADVASFKIVEKYILKSIFALYKNMQEKIMQPGACMGV